MNRGPSTHYIGLNSGPPTHCILNRTDGPSTYYILMDDGPPTLSTSFLYILIHNNFLYVTQYSRKSDYKETKPEDFYHGYMTLYNHKNCIYDLLLFPLPSSPLLFPYLITSDPHETARLNRDTATM